MNMNVSVKLLWNYDISQAPRDQKIIVASDCGKVFSSRWLPAKGKDGDRWEGFSKGHDPIAWMPWPTHPNEVQ